MSMMQDNVNSAFVALPRVLLNSTCVVFIVCVAVEQVRE
jgi:hypothetical protein